MSELSGNCWRGTACVAPNGLVYPCIMAKRWPVGSLWDSTFSEIAGADQLHAIRQGIYHHLPPDSMEGTLIASTLRTRFLRAELRA